MCDLDEKDMLAALEFFRNPTNRLQRQYEALRAVCLDGRPVAEAARRFKLAEAELESLLEELQNDPDYDFGFLRGGEDPGGAIQRRRRKPSGR